MNPANWWHDLEGGEIAKQRPAPPGADQPYPNLATVPGRPTPPDRKQLESITSGLVADRANAQRAAEAAPLADPSSRTASPGLFGVGTAPPPPPPPPPSTAASAPAAASASLAAASAPPPPKPQPEGPPAAPKAAPVASVQSSPLPGPPPRQPSAAPAASAQSSPPPPGPQTQPAASPQSSALPGPQAYQPSAAARKAEAATPSAMPAAPPPPPALPGATQTVAAAAAPAPPPPGTTLVSFAPGSANLPPDAAGALKALIAGRGSAGIAVTGHGDAASNDPGAQSAALTLALARAKAVAGALEAQGVPASAVQVGAQAGGRGATVRLLK